MATNKITLDTGSTIHTGTYVITESALQINIPRSTLNKSDGSELGIDTAPMFVAPSGGTIATIGAVTDITNVVAVTGSVEVLNIVAVTGSTTIASLPAITGSVAVVNSITGSTTIVSQPAVTGSVAVVNVVSVTGSTAVVSQPAVTGSVAVVANVRPSVTSVTDGRTTVAATGSAVSIGTLACYKVIVVGETDNTGIVVVGGTTSTAALASRTGVPLYAAQSQVFECSNLNELYIDSTVAGEGATWIAYT